MSSTYPDGRLKELEPWTIEQVIRDEILRVEPHVVVTFPVHGISFGEDHKPPVKDLCEGLDAA